MVAQTVGSASYELLQKPAEKINVIDMQREMDKTFWPEIKETIKKNSSIVGPYYIVIINRRERNMPNVIRRQFVSPLFERPFPRYDWSLFSYDNSTCDLNYYWTIPDEDTCSYLLLNESSVREEEKQLLTFVKKFSEGSLV